MIIVNFLAFPNLTVKIYKFQVVMMLSAGYFRIRNALPKPVWTYPISYIAFHTYSLQARGFTLSYFASSVHNNAEKTVFDNEFLKFGQEKKRKKNKTKTKRKACLCVLLIRSSSTLYSGTTCLVLISLAY